MLFLPNLVSKFAVLTSYLYLYTCPYNLYTITGLIITNIYKHEQSTSQALYHHSDVHVHSLVRDKEVIEGRRHALGLELVWEVVRGVFSVSQAVGCWVTV